MHLTIITETNTVGKNGSFYSDLNLTQCQIPSNIWALQWGGSSGHIEFNSSAPNEDITDLPAWANACVSIWDAKDYEVKNPPDPTPEEKIASTKTLAVNKLMESDWAVLADVPLTNKVEWETYRFTIRQIATNPTVDPVWPVKPQSIWS